MNYLYLYGKELYTYGRYLIGNALAQWFNTSIIINALKIAFVWLWTIFIGIHTYIYCIGILMGIDIYTGIKASLKKGEPYRTKILKKGLLEKFVLYALVIIVMFVIDTIISHAIPYNNYFISLLASCMISFYEASSIIENLIVLYPDYPFLKRIAKVLNLLDSNVEKKITNIVSEADVNEGEK